jgi:hypothetical protein
MTDEKYRIVHMFHMGLVLQLTLRWFNVLRSEGKFLVTKFEFGGSFGINLEGDCHEVEVTLNLELLVTFGMSLEAHT